MECLDDLTIFSLHCGAKELSNAVHQFITYFENMEEREGNTRQEAMLQKYNRLFATASTLPNTVRAPWN